MSFYDGLVIALVLTLIAVFPAWPYSRKWGYYPSAGVSIVLLILLIVLVAGTV
jgi:low affinity Fe/Cu permease